MRDTSKINMSDLDDEYDNEMPEQDGKESGVGKKKEKEIKWPEKIKLPPQNICEADSFNDAFSIGISQYLRRFKSTDRGVTQNEIYVLDYVKDEYSAETKTVWRLMSYYKNKYDVLTLTPDYEDANKALKARIDEVLNPIAAEINTYLKKQGLDMNSAAFKQMVNGKLPTACGYYNEIIAILCDNTYYTLSRAIKDKMYIYCINMVLNSDSPIEDIKYITNDPAEKDKARYYYSIKPSKDKFDVAPDLKNYSPLWYKFLNGRFVNPKMDLLRLTHHLYSMICQECHTRQALALFDTGEAGKTILGEAFAAILPGAMTTGVSLHDLMGEFPPASINGARGIIIDEGQDLQKFFDGDFFKSITGAVDDNAMRLVNRKLKDHAPMRLGALRFTFITNSKLCIREKAGLTRISPMLIMPNFGRKRDGKAIITELVSEGADFIQYCIDSEQYYKNLTSKIHHWWCPIIEDNGTVNILTDEQFDAWYNETSEDWYFSEEDFNDPKMRDRIHKMNIENVMQATTDPKTGLCAVYGSLENVVVQDAMDHVLRQLFMKSDEGMTSLIDVARYIAKTVSISNNEMASRLREIGFKNERNLEASNVINTQAWKRLKTAIEAAFGVTAKKSKRDRRVYYKGLLFVKAPTLDVSERNTKDE